MNEQKKISNPFNTGSYARGEGFFGRIEILRDINSFLVNENQNTFVINGQRRVGKTSLLRKIQEESPKQNFTPVYFDLQDKSNQTLSEILFSLMDAIIEELEIAGSNPSKQDFEDDHRIFDEKFLPSILSSNAQIVLLFDEFDVMSYYKTVAKGEDAKNLAFDTFVPYISQLVEKKFPIKFVFAIGRTLSDLAISYGSITKFAITERLSYFSQEEASDLIQTLTKGSILYEDEAMKKIFELTCGQPYFLQCLSSFVFDVALEDNRYVIKPQHVDEELLAAVKKHTGGVDWLWKGFKPEEQSFLYAIALLEERGEKVLEETIIQELKRLDVKNISPKFSNVLENLVNFDILSRDIESENYRIKAKYVQKWLAYELTKVDFQRSIKQVDKVLGHHQLEIGKALLDEKNYGEAISFFNKVLDRDEDNFEAQYYLADAMYKSQKYDKDSLIEEYHKASKLNPYLAKDAYLNILQEAFDEKKDPKYLERILLEKDDQGTREKLLERWMEEWKTRFENLDCNLFKQKIEDNNWIIEKYGSKLVKFFEDTLRFLNSKENYKQTTVVFDVIPESLIPHQYYIFVKEAYEAQLVKLTQEYEAKLGKSAQKHEGLLSKLKQELEESVERVSVVTKEFEERIEKINIASKKELEKSISVCERNNAEKINTMRKEHEVEIAKERRIRWIAIVVIGVLLASAIGYYVTFSV